MSAKCSWLISIVMLGLMSCGDVAVAQVEVTKPASEASGYAASRLRNIYRQDIGTGFSVDTLAREDLRQAQARVPYVGQSLRQRSGMSLGLSAGPVSKPFSHYSSSPTVSPYMNLFREDFDGTSDMNYTTLVRPQLEQQRVNKELERQSIELARRLQAFSARSAYNTEGSEQMIPTGHSTVFQYYGHYYPTLGQRRR